VRMERANQERLTLATLETLVNALEAKDPYLRGHSARVADFAAMVAAELRMPDDQIDHALEMAAAIDGIVFLDVQVGKSTLEYELPQLEKYLKMPQVHLAVDPEFSMKFGNRPGTVIGTFDAADINYAAEYIAGLVRENHLPPKVLVVHRFTYDMVTNYKKIQPLPEVQIVMDMDGFGSKAKKYGTYNRVVAPEPVQFTGIKLFYRNDVRPPADGLLSPAEVLKLIPAPIYIQYQ